MNWIIAGIAVVGVAASALGQTGPVIGELVWNTRPTTIAIVRADKTVAINWEQVEKTAADPKSTAPMTLNLARLLLAVRDGTWEPLDETRP